MVDNIRYVPLSRDDVQSWVPSLRAVDGDVDWMKWPDDAYTMDLPMKWELSRIALVDDKPVGYALVSSKGKTAWLHRIAVAAERRSTGTGAAIIAEVMDIARRHGFRALGLKTPVRNARARAFYERIGFHEESTEGEYSQMSVSLRSTIVGIHQPNFVPWLGYFYKMHRSDVFVVLDDVLAPSRGYFNRAKVLVQGNGRWLTVPVSRGDGYIHHMETSGDEWIAKHVKTLHHSYQKTPYFEQLIPGIADLLHASGQQSLAELNLTLIKHVSTLLGINTSLKLASDYALDSSGDRRLVDLVSSVGGTAYLSGKGGDNYQVPATFENAGIDLLYTGFDSPMYNQHTVGEFVPGLSVLDALFNIGPEATMNLIENAPMPEAKIGEQ